MASAQQKIDRAFAAIERHRPGRARWANRMVEQGWVDRLLMMRAMAWLGLPFVLMGSICFWSGLWPVPGAGRVALCLAGSGLAACLLPWVLLRALLKRSSLLVSASELAVTMTYVRSCPRLSSAIRGWLVQSQDAMLTSHELSLVYRAARAMELSLGATHAGPGAILDASFYEAAPQAPRFTSDQGGEAKEFARAVACIDAETHFLAATRAARLDRAMPVSSGSQAPVRL